MISIVYLLLYMAAGMQMIRFLLPRKSPLVRGWLGAALGMLLEMQLPALFAWLFGFTIKAHIAAVAALAAILAACRYLRDKRSPAAMTAEDKRQAAVMAAVCLPLTAL